MNLNMIRPKKDLEGSLLWITKNCEILPNKPIEKQRNISFQTTNLIKRILDDRIIKSRSTHFYF